MDLAYFVTESKRDGHAEYLKQQSREICPEAARMNPSVVKFVRNTDFHFTWKYLFLSTCFTLLMGTLYKPYPNLPDSE
jgi:hypothetical protein